MSAISNQSLGFKLRKVVRYMRLYGPRRTWIKVRGDFHMRKEQDFPGARWNNPACRSAEDSDRFVALIGCGNFTYANIAYYLRKRSPNFLRATYDVKRSRARSLCEDYGGLYAAGDPEQILADDKVRLVYVASNHASHAEYAIRALDAGKHVHIEKPHVINAAQLQGLRDACARNPNGMVFLGFNRPRSRLFQALQEALRQEAGPLMVNWFIAGHHMPMDHWYFSEAEGGRILGNVCHWTDLTLQLIGVERAFPCTVSAVSDPQSKSDFAISMIFADQSVAAITFSAKGHTFEGVREVLNAHRGDTMVSLADFHRMRIDTGPLRRYSAPLFRDHGHRVNIENSLLAVVRGDRSRAVPEVYWDATARLFLAVKEAVDHRRSVTVDLLAAPRGEGKVDQVISLLGRA